ncbi:cytochrome-c oxidase, cbb3-type subunit III [Neisseria animalis]|uniref:Cytochrome c oxidase subunit III n=1 Tax=Neisseria animalis TaxID=492 RepID=A0A5P3MQ05_NEIAN|nr:cytochrome-c oxidase, cbb3-type subunit III [Neisseria animalis]QEY23500.1 cytochrome-c oxidase, cbb3-type subunit III [Neisseria animalis]ROW33346.1 cytochrome-c oxidase, cbb3-type subunit III [Neisseria animalis]VEE09082.1 cytochrome C oxidase, subunit III [Neisseria animalis]
MNTTSQFTSNFWNIYIAAIVVLSFIGLAWLLISQNVVKLKKGEEAKTTGHEWDGIEEYNNPLPRWWFWLYVLTWIFGAVYIVLYPGVGDFKGVLGWTSHNQYEKEVAKAEEQYKPLYAKFANMPIEQVAKDPQVQQIGKNMFDTYCIQCHGADAKGSKGFPNLTDHDWLWGGEPEQIRETIEKGRVGVMAAWGPALGEERVKDVAHYVMSLSKPKDQYDEDRAARGKALFHGGPANCFTCHGDQGQGVQGLGPNLSDDVWLWGGTQKAIIETITNGRHGQMPAWANFLDNDKLHIMTAYVWGLSNKDGKAPAPKAQPAAAAQPATASAAAAQPTEPAAPVAEQAAAPADDADGVVLSNKDGKPQGIFYFATGKSDVSANAAGVLEEIIKAGKDGKRLVVSGYTDSTGNAAANAELSKKRAQAVQAFFEAQGVKAENIELRKPEDTTAAQGDNAAGRRVEVTVEG